MPKYDVAQIRNIALCGHGHSGKTTLVDRLLFKTGAVNRQASVTDGTSICDFDEEEKHHKYTIETAVVHCDHAGKRFNIVDTPGYPDFIGQTICALRGVDTAAIVINAHAGIEVNTRRVFDEAGKAGLGRMLVINKLDEHNINFAKIVENLQKLFGAGCILLNVPNAVGDDFKSVISTLKPGGAKSAVGDPAAIGQSLLETIIEMDDAVTEKYFSGQQPTDEEIARLMVEAVATGHLIPIVCTSGKTEVGLMEMLDAFNLCAVPPNRIEHKARNAAGEDVVLKSEAGAPLAAQVFKTRIDPFVQKLSFIRVYSGTLKKDDSVHASSARKSIKITQLFEVQGSETHAIDAAGPGYIVAVAKAEDLHTGTSLGDLTLPPLQFPTPMVGLAVTPKTRGDEAKLSGALHKLAEEDSTFHLGRDAQTKELVMTGMSELHLQVIQERLKRRDKVEVDAKEPKIPYRETIQANAEGSYRHKKQSGGRGQFGEVHIRMYPLPSGLEPAKWATKERFPSMREFHYDALHNFMWVDSIVGGTIPNNFLPAVEKGFKERLDRGVIAGYQIQNVCVEVHFGKHHPVDSSEAAFKTAGSMAFRNVFQEAKPGLLEPIVKLHVTVPGDKLGDINSDMSGRRGRVLGMEAAGGELQTVIAEVPLAEITTYARSLSSITGGQGSFHVELSHYDVVPGNILKDIISKTVMKEEEEE